MANIYGHVINAMQVCHILQYCTLSEKPRKLKIHSVEPLYVRMTVAVRCDRRFSGENAFIVRHIPIIIIIIIVVVVVVAR